MDVLLTPLTDIIKHYIQTTYLTYEDNKLNLLLYTFISAFIAILCKYILSNNNTIIKYCIWYIKYKILKKECCEIVIYRRDEDEISNNTINNNHYSISITDSQLLIYFKIIQHILNNGSSFTNTYSFTDNNRYFDITNGNNYIYEFYYDDTYQKVGFINGYNIYTKYNRETNMLFFYCNNAYSYQTNNYVNKFLFELKKIYKNEIKNIEYTKTLNIVEYKNKKLEIVGIIKQNLTIDNYVSKYKSLIIKKLEAFKNEKLFENNPYIENNLGILAHGTYGTGKSFLITIIANYLNRSICNVNFTKIKTKTEFKAIVNQENNLKYIYAFDEFDYLLADLFKNNNKDDQDEQKLKIQALTAQIIATKDNKEVSEKLIEEMKSIMSDSDDKLTYSFLLSELSGISSCKNRVIIATTNFIDRIPDALKRPNRFDLILHLDVFNNDEIKELLEKLYKPNNHQLQKLHKTTFIEKYTPAQIILKSVEYDNIDDMIKYLTT